MLRAASPVGRAFDALFRLENRIAAALVFATNPVATPSPRYGRFTAEMRQGLEENHPQALVC